MLETAKSFRETNAFAHVDSDLEDSLRIFEFFDLTATQLPAIRLIKIKGDLIKYKYDNENEISAVNLTHFVQKCLDNKIVPHYRSQKFLEDWNSGPVKTLVQSNIISVSQDLSKAVLVEIYASWYGICQRMEPVYNLLGTHFENNSDVFVAKIDATLNEILSIHIRSFPTIMLFQKSENTQPIVYGGNRTLESFIVFFKSGEYLNQQLWTRINP
ncbi:hypothetical protein GJ496_004784 [Pomphorhynchus laevis]|nr:hypothetical protein GJ496_004784 [Pomphorhynchus laevis]